MPRGTKGGKKGGVSVHIGAAELIDELLLEHVEAHYLHTTRATHSTHDYGERSAQSTVTVTEARAGSVCVCVRAHAHAHAHAHARARAVCERERKLMYPSGGLLALLDLHVADLAQHAVILLEHRAGVQAPTDELLLRDVRKVHRPQPAVTLLLVAVI